jgi:hypothetical protein
MRFTARIWLHDFDDRPYLQMIELEADDEAQAEELAACWAKEHAPGDDFGGVHVELIKE